MGWLQGLRAPRALRHPYTGLFWATRGGGAEAVSFVPVPTVLSRVLRSQAVTPGSSKRKKETKFDFFFFFS